MAIDHGKFSDKCIEYSLQFGVHAHFLLAVAQILSGISDDSQGDRIGPFRVTQEEWDATPPAPEFEFALRPNRIKSWRTQCGYAALKTYRAQTQLRRDLERMPSAVELYQAWPATDIQLPGDLQSALDQTAHLIPQNSQSAQLGSASEPLTRVGSGTVAGAGGVLGELIASGEGDYQSFNRGRAGDSVGKKIDFSTMTVAQLMKRQALKKSDPNRIFAFGKYQVIPKTMQGAVTALGVSQSKKVTPWLQEMIFRRYLVAGKRPKIKGYIAGTHDDLANAQLALAMEFASVADPRTGKSYYDKQGGNSSSITAQQSAAALREERKMFADLIQHGNTQDQAWLALSPGLSG